MLGILAQASDGTSGGASQLAAFLPLILMGVIFYFLLIRPQNQRRRAQMQMQSELDVGDEVVTSAGIYGTITEIDDEFGIITLELSPGMEVRFARAAVAQRVVDDEELEEVEEAEPGS
ncbi:MAG TPA: preprotein translocase subunit YajC [Actinomycetota bacterium]|nr:preprotein translocase subunit YajC [Actinomycetota bacterium]